MTKIIHTLVLMACVCSQTVLSETAPKPQDIGEAKPVILGIISSISTLRLAAILDTTNRALLKEKIEQLRSYIASPGGPNDRLKMELVAWEKALAEWKEGDPIPRGIAYVVIAEEGGEFCVAYYPSHEAALVFYVDKISYKCHGRSGTRCMKAIDFDQIEKSLE